MQKKEKPKTVLTKRGRKPKSQSKKLSQIQSQNIQEEDLPFSTSILKNLKKIDNNAKISKKSVKILNDFLIEKLKQTMKIANEVRMENSKRIRVNPEDLIAALKLQCQNEITKNMIIEGNELLESMKQKHVSRANIEESGEFS